VANGFTVAAYVNTDRRGVPRSGENGGAGRGVDGSAAFLLAALLAKA